MCTLLMIVSALAFSAPNNSIYGHLSCVQELVGHPICWHFAIYPAGTLPQILECSAAPGTARQMPCGMKNIIISEEVLVSHNFVSGAS